MNDNEKPDWTWAFADAFGFICALLATLILFTLLLAEKQP